MQASAMKKLPLTKIAFAKFAGLCKGGREGCGIILNVKFQIQLTFLTTKFYKLSDFRRNAVTPTTSWPLSQQTYRLQHSCVL